MRQPGWAWARRSCRTWRRACRCCACWAQAWGMRWWHATPPPN